MLSKYIRRLRFCYQKEFDHSVKDPRGFWRSQLPRVSWFKEPKQILDDSNPPFFKWFKDGELNLAYNCLDRHLKTLKNEIALHHISPGTNTDISITYGQLQEQVSKLAGGLKQQLGLQVGDTVIIYLPMIPEAAVAMLSCAQIGVIHSVVYGGFAAPELASRIRDAKPKAIITCTFGIDGHKKILYKPIVDEAIKLSEVKGVKTIVYQREGEMANYTDYDFKELIAKSKPTQAVSLPANHPAYILYTSGTTGRPKGVVRDVGGIAMALDYVCDKIFDIGPKDVMFSSSDIGWVVGTSFNVYGPLLRGAQSIFYEGKPIGTPDAGAFWKIIQDKKVKHLYTAPTALRVIRKEDVSSSYMKKYDTSSLKGISFAGERCDIPTLNWVKDSFPGMFINDNYWQTESGYMIISNYMNLTTFPLKAGSATKPVPGFNVKILDDDGNECADEQQGKVCIKYPTPPTFASTLWNNDETFVEKYFKEYEGYYFTGDSGYRGADGYYHIMSRMDDVIKVAGHRLSTAQMEEVLMHHKNVAEAIVVGVKDEVKGEIPIGFVTLKEGIELQQNELITFEKEVVKLMRDQIGPVASFKTCVVVHKLPKTRSGKYLRNIIRAMSNKQAYTPPGTIEDISVLEPLQIQIDKLNLSLGIQFEEDIQKEPQDVTK